MEKIIQITGAGNERISDDGNYLYALTADGKVYYWYEHQWFELKSRN